MTLFTFWAVVVLNSSEPGGAGCWEGRGLNVKLVEEPGRGAAADLWDVCISCGGDLTDMEQC